MGKVIVITSGKGGVGKTTSTANIGTALAMLGHKVALLDTDIGLRNLDVIMGLENRIVYDLVDAVRGNCRLKQALIKDKRLDNLYLLPAAQPEVSAVRDADRIIGLLEAAGLESPRLIVNRMRNSLVKSGDMMSVDDVLDILAIDLLGVVPDDDAIVISSNKGEPTVFDAKSRPGLAYRNIARRLTGEEVPLMNLDEKQSFFTKLKSLFRSE